METEHEESTICFRHHLTNVHELASRGCSRRSVCGKGRKRAERGGL